MYRLPVIGAVVLWACLGIIDVEGQTITRRELLRGEMGRVYFSERSLYLTLQLRSLVIGIQQGQIVHYNRTVVRYAELGQILHPKERTVTQTDHHGNRLRTLKYGKANHLFVFRTGKGRSALLGNIDWAPLLVWSNRTTSYCASTKMGRTIQMKFDTRPRLRSGF